MFNLHRRRRATGVCQQRQAPIPPAPIMISCVCGFQESQVISQLIENYHIGSTGVEQLNARCAPSNNDDGKFLLTDFNGLYIILGILIILSIIVQYINVKFLHAPIDPFDDDFGEGRKHNLQKGSSSTLELRHRIANEEQLARSVAYARLVTDRSPYVLDRSQSVCTFVLLCPQSHQTAGLSLHSLCKSLIQCSAALSECKPLLPF
jgi:hypothetical protein